MYAFIQVHDNWIDVLGKSCPFSDQIMFLKFSFSWCVFFQVYALTKERDTLRREQSKKSDAAALLKEKDEIINQVMAEGEF